MKTGMMAELTKTTIIAAALLSASFAFAGPSVPSPEMKTALAKAMEGPTQLRRYVERTKPIYNLDYFEVMTLHEARKAASGDEAPVVANGEAE